MASSVKKDAEKLSEPVAQKSDKRSRISQSDIPAYGLSDALRVSRAIHENYAGHATRPLDVAAAMDISPTSSTFKMLTGASIAYGLTEGGYNAASINLTALANRILSPLEEGDDIAASREALRKPKIVGEFLGKYDGKQIPKDDIAANVIAAMGVPRERSSEVFEMIVGAAEKLGLITDIKGKRYVNLQAAGNTASTLVDEESSVSSIIPEDGDIVAPAAALDAPFNNKSERQPLEGNRRVFITHGKNKAFVDPIKKLLSFGELEAVVSVESQSVSQPVPEKVMSEMRSCGAAIIHVTAELVLMDKDANEHVVLNPNVLIEIGAAMALYGKRFILLVKDGVKLPSNLQGLFEVRYSSDQLDGDATIRLLEAINALKATKSP